MNEERGERWPTRLPYLLVAAALSALAGACSVQAPSPHQGLEMPGTSPSAETSSPTPKPTHTASPTATDVPGFEGWSMINPQDVQIKTESGALIMTLTHKALWFMQQRGVLFYRPVSGDFRITADVRTSKSSDPAQAPGGNGSVQLGGIMARSGEGSQENYVFIVVGDDGNGLSVETKNTIDSLSKFDGPEWGSPDAELRLCRVGKIISAYKRHAGTGEPWMEAASYERTDLPERLQVGVNLYTDSAPDLRVRYDNVKIEPVKENADCKR